MAIFGWQYQVEIVAEALKINVDEAYKLDLLRFLNCLVYIKEKNNFLNQQFDKKL